MRRAGLNIWFFVFMTTSLLSQQSSPQNLTGPYLGQQPPGATAKIFAPEIVSTGLDETVISFMPDGNECYWAVLLNMGIEAILTSRLENGKWTKPEVASFSGRYLDGWPAIQPDGKKMFFHSYRPLDNKNEPSTYINIWSVERIGNMWSPPEPLGAQVNGNGHSCNPSIAKNGTLYFSKTFLDGSEKICRSRFVNGKYMEIEKLPENINIGRVNYHAYIAPDESYLIYPTDAKPDILGGGWNYYVSFRGQGDKWSDLINIGPSVNSERSSDSASLSADGRYLFFRAGTKINRAKSLSSKHSLKELLERESRIPSRLTDDIYWIEAKMIEQLRPSAFK
jgi:hypothetical protein